MIKKIISGGQTGADIAGVDAAIESNISYGGWLPKGRKAENGIVPEKYSAFQVMTRGGYPMRTEQNVKDSDGTVIFTFGKLSGGSSLTKKYAVKNKKPWVHIDLTAKTDPTEKLKNWLLDWDIQILNVAGKSASKAQNVYGLVKSIIQDVLR